MASIFFTPISQTPYSPSILSPTMNQYVAQVLQQSFEAEKCNEFLNGLKNHCVPIFFSKLINRITFEDEGALRAITALKRLWAELFLSSHATQYLDEEGNSRVFNLYNPRQYLALRREIFPNGVMKDPKKEGEILTELQHIL